MALVLPKRARRLAAAGQQQLDTSADQQQAVGQQQQAAASGEGASAGGLRSRSRDPFELPYEPLADAARLPATLTWRGSDADSYVPDQVRVEEEVGWGWDSLPATECLVC